MNRLFVTFIMAVAAFCCSVVTAAGQSVAPFHTTTITNSQFADDTHWYSISIRNGKYLYVDADTHQIYCSAITPPTADRQEFLWAFTGNATDGYRFHNYTTGAAFCLGSYTVEDKVHPTMLSDATYDTFRLTPNGDGFSVSLDGFTDIYLNDLSNLGILGYWANAAGLTSNGSRMIFSEVEMPGGTVDPGETVDPDILADELSMLLDEAQQAYDSNMAYAPEALIRSVSQLYCPFGQNDLGRDKDGGGLEALIDNNPDTYYHTQWQTADGGRYYPEAGEHYLRVAAPEDPGFSGTITVSTTRRKSNNDHPTAFTVYGSNDRTNWDEVGDIALGNATNGATATTTLTLAKTYRYLRFNCTKTSNTANNSFFFHMAEFQLYCGETVDPTCVNAIIGKPANDMAAALATASQLLSAADNGEAVVTQHDIDALNAAFQAYRDAIDAYRESLFPGNPADLVINEIQVANIDQYLDPSFNYSGWIELYNPTGKDISLNELYIVGRNHNGVDEAPFRFHFPLDSRYDYGFVPAHGFKNVWFDHYAIYGNKPISEHEAYKQVYWRLDPDGGHVALLGSDGQTVLCSLDYPAMPPRSSYARTTDGGDTWAWHACGTPASSNNDAHDYLAAPLRLAAPEVDTESQVNGSVTNFSVSIPDGAILRYTLNGAAPTALSAESSDGHFSVGMYGTQTYRFRLFKDGYLPSPVVTRSFINDTKGNNMPVIAVTTADANLNSSSYGIFATYGPNGRPGMGATSNSNRNMDWERPANVEYFDLTGNAGGYECVINQEADIAVAGGWSRKSYTPPPFKIKAAEQYEGVKYLHYPVFKDKPYTKHRTLFMRHEQDLLDVGIQEIARRSGLNIDTQAWEPAELYINGVSKGYVPIREPSNKHFALANYGIDTDLVDVFEVSCDSNYIQSTGTREAFDRWYDLAERCGRDEAAYRELCELVDIDEYLNYMATEFYIFNTDWPWNNVKGFRASDGKFRMILMDIGDQGFAHAGNHASPSESPFEYFRSWKDQHYLGYGETRFVTIFFNMMQHEAIRRQFVDTYCLVAYSVYDPDFITEVMGELVAKCNGWVNDSRIRTTLTPQWQNQEMRHLTLLPEAGVSMDDVFTINLATDTEGARLHLNGLPIPRHRFNGTLFAPATLSAAAPAGYSFVGWKDAEGNILSTDIDWTIAEGNKTAWGNVTASFRQLTPQDHAAPVRINEVSAANDMYVNELWDRKDWVELYNTTDEPIDVAGMYLSDNADKPTKWRIPAASMGDMAGASTANTVIPAHGTLIIWCDKEPAGQQLHASFKLSNTDGCVVTLQAADASWTDRLSYNIHGGRESVGRYPDGSDRTCLFVRPTIDAPNYYGYFGFKSILPASIGQVAHLIDRALKGEATLSEIESLVGRVLKGE